MNWTLCIGVIQCGLSCKKIHFWVKIVKLVEVKSESFLDTGPHCMRVDIKLVVNDVQKFIRPKLLPITFLRLRKCGWDHILICAQKSDFAQASYPKALCVIHKRHNYFGVSHTPNTWWWWCKYFISNQEEYTRFTAQHKPLTNHLAVAVALHLTGVSSKSQSHEFIFPFLSHLTQPKTEYFRHKEFPNRCGSRVERRGSKNHRPNSLVSNKLIGYGHKWRPDCGSFRQGLVRQDLRPGNSISTI